MNTTNKYNVPSELPDGRHNPEYNHKYYERHRQHQAEIVLRWRKNHPKQVKEYNRRWNKKHPDIMNKWGKEHPKLKREANNRWRKNNLRKARISSSRRHHKRQRGLPTTRILGKPFKNSHLHHLSPSTGVYIPKKLHQSVPHNIWTGKNMTKINVLAMLFYECSQFINY